MLNWRAATALLLAGSMAWPAVGLGDERGPTGYTTKELQAFAKQFQEAVASGKHGKVAQFVSFPVRVNYATGKHRMIEASEFLRSYDAIFTPAVKEAVLKQDLNDLHESWRGTMFGAGTVWASGVCEDSKCVKSKLRVIAINFE